MMTHVMPVVTQGLLECLKTRPEDATDFMAALKGRNRALEAAVEQLLEQLAAQQPQRARPPTARPAEGFGMSHTRDAIREAVQQAAGLPEAERRKKVAESLAALRRKE